MLLAVAYQQFEFFSMQFLKLVGAVLHQSQKAARSLGRSVQEVVEVLQPGPLGSTAVRWDAQRRADANHAVQQAVANWQALQQQLQWQEQQERDRQQEQQQLEEWQAQQQHNAVTMQLAEQQQQQQLLQQQHEHQQQYRVH